MHEASTCEQTPVAAGVRARPSVNSPQCTVDSCTSHQLPAGPWASAGSAPLLKGRTLAATTPSPPHRPCACAGHARKLRVTANPNITLTRAHVPPWCRNARVVLLGPLTLHDLDAASFLTRSGAPALLPGAQLLCLPDPCAAYAAVWNRVAAQCLALCTWWMCGGETCEAEDPCTCITHSSPQGCVTRQLNTGACCAASGPLLPPPPPHSGWLDAWFNWAQLVGFMAQGFQRLLDAEGAVLPLKAPSSQLLVRSSHQHHTFSTWAARVAVFLLCLQQHTAEHDGFAPDPPPSHPGRPRACFPSVIVTDLGACLLAGWVGAPCIFVPVRCRDCHMERGGAAAGGRQRGSSAGHRGGEGSHGVPGGPRCACANR